VIGLVRRVMSRCCPVREADTFHGVVPVGQEPELQPPPGDFNVVEPKVDLSIHDEIVYRARLTCANYCVRNGLGSAELRELLEMLGLADGEVFPQGVQTLTYSHS
jgi:hypothetical protein